MKYKIILDKAIGAVKAIKITMPVAVLLGAIIFSFSFFAVQSSKNESIERQYRSNLLIEAEQKDLQAKRAECESLAVGVRKQWNNVMGVTYDDTLWKECVVTYTDTETGEIETSPLRWMKTVR